MLRLSVGSAGVGNLWGRWVSRAAAGAAILWAAASLPAQSGPVEPRAGVSPLRPEQGPTHGQEAVKLPSEASTNWWTQAQKQLQDSEYQASKAESGTLQAPNRAQNLRSWFDESGALTVPRDAASPEAAAWQWGLALQRYGWQGGEMLAVAPATPVAEKNTVTYQRSPLLREWYVNEAAGLKSWFEIKSAPPGSGSSLRLELALRGNTVATMGTGDKAQTVEFRTESGASVIQYSGLKAWDATGRELACTLSLSGEKTVVLNVDAAGAVFPVTIDPLASTPDWTGVGDQAAALFGDSVASAGDVNGDGYSDVIVGAPYHTKNYTFQGRASVYLGSASGLSLNPAWTAAGDQADDRFGSSVASAGDVNGDGYDDIIVGAPPVITAQRNGRAYVYLGSASGLSSSSAWMAVGDQTGFGYKVASAGDVNGDGFSDVIVSSGGQVFLYLGSSTGLASVWAWSVGGSVPSAAGDVNGDGFSDVVVSGSGRVFLYFGSSTGLASNWAWSTGGEELGVTNFGSSVASAGDVNGDGYSDIIVGAMSAGSEPVRPAYVCVYLGSASGLTQNPVWSAISRDPTNTLSVGSAGDINGDGYDDVIMGTPGWLLPFTSSPENWTQGSLSLYLGSAVGLDLNPAWVGEHQNYLDRYGQSVAAAEDVNGDGFFDVIVGAPGTNIGPIFGGTDIGRAYVYYGVSRPYIRVYGGGQLISTGKELPSIGDLTDFGFTDINAREDQSKVRAFQIKNKGTELLQWNAASISSSDFSILSPTAFPVLVQPGASTLLRIRAVPKAIGQTTATFSLTSNDPYTPTYTFALQAEGVSASNSTPGKVDDFARTSDWLELGIPDSSLPILGNPVGLGSRGYDPVNTALLMTVTTNTQSRVVGWREDPETDLPYSSIGPDRVARATFGIYSVPAPGSTPSPDPNGLSSVPNFRLRLMQYFVINSMLEVNHNSGNTDPGIRPLAREFAPSTDPTKPSIYTVDLDPVEIPYLLGSAGATVGIQRGIETVGVVNGLQPDFQYVQGTIALTDSSVGTYPIPNPAQPPAKVYGADSSDFSNDANILLTKFSLDRDALLSGIISGFDANPRDVSLYRLPSLGMVVDTGGLPPSKVGVAAADFLDGTYYDQLHPEARLRIDPERLYKISFRMDSRGLDRTPPQIRLRVRTAKFQWAQVLELSGPAAVGSEIGRTIAAQSIPGPSTNQNPDFNEFGYGYHVWFSSPISSKIRADVSGTLFDKFPLLMAQPGMGDPNPQSARDLKIGFDVIDSLNTGAGYEQEQASNIVLRRIEIRDYPQVDINQP